MQGRGERGKKENKERILWVGAKDGGRYMGIMGITTGSDIPLSGYTHGPAFQVSITKGALQTNQGSRHRTYVAG